MKIGNLFPIVIVLIIYGSELSFALYATLHSSMMILAKLAYLSVIILCVSFAFVSYMFAMFKNPGFIDPDTTENKFSEEELNLIKMQTIEHKNRIESFGSQLKTASEESKAEILNQLNFEYISAIQKNTWCSSCKVVRPPRAHHCSKYV